MVKSHSPRELYSLRSFSLKMNSVWNFIFLLLFSMVNLWLIEKVHGQSTRELGDRCSDVSGCNCGEQCVDLLDMKPCRAENASDCVCLQGCAVADVFIPAGVTRRNTNCNTCRCSVAGNGIPLCTKLPWCNLPDGVPMYRENPKCIEMIRINFPLRHEYSRSGGSWRYPPYKTRALEWKFPFKTATRSSENPSLLKSRSTGEELRRSPEKATAIDWWITPISKIRSKNGLNPPFQEIQTGNSWQPPMKETRSIENTNIPLEATEFKDPYYQPKDKRSTDSFRSNDEVQATPKQRRQFYEFNESLKKTRAMNLWLQHLTTARSNNRFILRPKMARASDWRFPYLTESKTHDELNALPKETRAMEWWLPENTEAKSNDELIIPPKSTRGSMWQFHLTESKDNDELNILPKKTRAMNLLFPHIIEDNSNGAITLRPKVARALNLWFPHLTGSNLNEISSSPSESGPHEFNPPPKQSRAMAWWNPPPKETVSKIGVNPPFMDKRAMDWLLQAHKDVRSSEDNGQTLQHTALKKQYNALEQTRSLNRLAPPLNEASSNGKLFKLPW